LTNIVTLINKNSFASSVTDKTVYLKNFDKQENILFINLHFNF